MEKWDFADEKDLQNWKGARKCRTFQNFPYSVDGLQFPPATTPNQTTGWNICGLKDLNEN